MFKEGDWKMKKSNKIIITGILALGILITVVTVILVKGNFTKNDLKANIAANSILADNESKLTNVGTNSQSRTDEGKMASVLNTT